MCNQGGCLSVLYVIGSYRNKNHSMNEPSLSQTNSYSMDIPARERPDIGVLLVHGLNADTSDYAELATVLEAAGCVTENVLLPGHGPGSRGRAALSTGWFAWA